tara:strand:- start:46158 stop:46493 length:336 start_codon:yes stop_codon:yes gene_type:complete
MTKETETTTNENELSYDLYQRIVGHYMGWLDSAPESDIFGRHGETCSLSDYFENKLPFEEIKQWFLEKATPHISREKIDKMLKSASQEASLGLWDEAAREEYVQLTDHGEY